MKTDIIKRLRNVQDHELMELCIDAAKEIKTLRDGLSDIINVDHPWNGGSVDQCRLIAIKALGLDNDNR